MGVTGLVSPMFMGVVMSKHRIFTMSFARVYPCYVTKAQKKGRTQEEVDLIICWLTGYDLSELHGCVKGDMTIEDFFGRAPAMHPARHLVTGVVCGVRVEDVEDPLMREIRILDKMIDELAKGKVMEKILRRLPDGDGTTGTNQ